MTGEGGRQVGGYGGMCVCGGHDEDEVHEKEELEKEKSVVSGQEMN